MKIIFDFNRTLYQPEEERLMPKTKTVLAQLKKRGYMLFLIARAVPGRKRLMERLGITQYFTKIVTTPKKSKRMFKRIISGDPRKVTIVGDRVRDEIKLGNSLGMTTVWLKQGKFRNEEPRTTKEMPSCTIYNLYRLLKLLG